MLFLDSDQHERPAAVLKMMNQYEKLNFIQSVQKSSVMNTVDDDRASEKNNFYRQHLMTKVRKCNRREYYSTSIVFLDNVLMYKNNKHKRNENSAVTMESLRRCSSVDQTMK